MNSPAIFLENVIKQRGNKPVLNGVNLDVPCGSVVGLLGRNGSGKSTLLKCALGLLKPQSGQCQLLGEDSWDLSARAKGRIGYVPQVINLYPWMKVSEYAQYTASFYQNWNQQLASRLMAEWELPATDRIAALSVGTLQKLAILTAVAHEPDLLILDEPAASLDPQGRRQFLQLIVDLAEPGRRSVLFSTHITSDLERIADTVAVLNDGRITHFGPMEELKAQTHLNLEDAFLEMINA
jgi:ABC-2 type transport system ATP-binding protein